MKTYKEYEKSRRYAITKYNNNHPITKIKAWNFVI